MSGIYNIDELVAKADRGDAAFTVQYDGSTQKWHGHMHVMNGGELETLDCSPISFDNLLKYLLAAMPNEK